MSVRWFDETKVFYTKDISGTLQKKASPVSLALSRKINQVVECSGPIVKAFSSFGPNRKASDKCLLGQQIFFYKTLSWVVLKTDLARTISISTSFTVLSSAWGGSGGLLWTLNLRLCGHTVPRWRISLKLLLLARTEDTSLYYDMWHIPLMQGICHMWNQHCCILLMCIGMNLATQWILLYNIL